MGNARKEAESEIEIFALAASKHKETIERYTEMETKITTQMAKIQEAATAAATATAASVATAPLAGQQQQQQEQ